MREIYSNANDCRKLAKQLKKKMGNRIEFDGFQEVWSGKYFHYHRQTHSDLDYLFEDGLPFYYKFCKGEFLRIGIGSSYKHKTSVGEKLAALSSFYEILSEQYGEPTVFYTLKNDEEGTLSLQWSFNNKKEDIEELKNGSYFDDGEIDNLIVIGEEKIQNNSYQLKESTKTTNARAIGVPKELVSLVVDNLEDYVKYKNGKEVGIPEDAKIDGVPVISLQMKISTK